MYWQLHIYLEAACWIALPKGRNGIGVTSLSAWTGRQQSAGPLPPLLIPLLLLHHHPFLPFLPRLLPDLQAQQRPLRL